MPNLQSLISAQYQLGNDQKIAFQNICQKLDLEPLPMKYLKKWVKRLINKKRPIYYHSEHIDHFSIFVQICEFYFSINYSLLVKKQEMNKDFKFLPDNPRYGIKCEVKNDKLIGLQMIDYFHGQIRSLPFVDKSPFQDKSTGRLSIFPIDSKQLLICEFLKQPNNSVTSNFYLVSIDLKTSQCQLLDSKSDNQMCPKDIVFDELDRQKFAILSEVKNPEDHETTDTWAIQCYVENDKIYLNSEKVKIHNYYGIYGSVDAYKLVGNQIQGLKFGQDEFGHNNLLLDFCWKRDLTKLVDSPINPEYSITQTHHNPTDSIIYAYLCSGPICYIALNGYPNNNFITVHSFNIETSKHKIIACFLHEKVSDLCLDQNNYLFIKTDVNVYKVPLEESKKPRLLHKLLWNCVKEQSILNGTNLYDELMEKLPSNDEYQPFHFNNQ